MKNKLIIAGVLAVLGIAAFGILGQGGPPPPEPVSIHVCGPVIVSDGDSLATLELARQAIAADGCVPQFEHFGGYNNQWVVYGSRAFLGIETKD